MCEKLISINLNILTKFKVYALGFILTILFISCNNGNKEAPTKKSEPGNTESFQEKKNQISTTDRDSIIKNLQGEWRETQYPFRLAHFKNTTVKFTEEGVVEAPTFQDFNILQECPFEVNNIKNARPNNIFLVMVEAKTCEILMVSKDTLTLSGFNTHTNSNYDIIYSKVQ